jgi:NADH-quinone oxidoreductase subunit G
MAVSPGERREITLLVDGREVVAPEGEMLVDAAKRGDIEVPVFCYEPKLGEPVGACRMCLVEIEGMPKLQTACSTPIRDGMVVYTQTDQVKEAQNAVVEFLLVNHPLDCPVCDKGGECPLQDIAMGWGPGRSRFTEPKRHFQKPVELSPLIAIDRERCILCYRCVRFSQEISEDEQLQLLERGDRSYVATFDDRPYIAPFHGNITELCPVGALTNYTYRFVARPWDIEEAGSICTLCPSQCNVRFTVRDEKVARVLARDNSEVDDGWLCDKGRYGFQMLASDERLTAPMLREGGNLRRASWEEAIGRAAAGLREAGAESAALIGDAANEEGYLVQHILRVALGSADVESRLAGGASRTALLALSRRELSAKVGDLDSADAILVVGTDPLHSSPILDLRIRKAVRRAGARLGVASERPTALDGGAEAITRYAPGGATEFLSALAAALRVGGKGGIAGPVADAHRHAQRMVVVWGERIAREGQSALWALLDAGAALGLEGKAGSGLLEVPEATNARGLREVGCIPDAGPGLVETPLGRDADRIRGALENDELKALLLFGADPVRDAPDSAAWTRALTAADFVVAFSMFEDASTSHADVIFPLQSHAEKEGTVTHPDGRLQRVRPSVPDPDDVRPGWQVLCELSAALGHETGLFSVPDVLAAITEEVPFYAGLTLEEIGGRGIRWQEREGGGAIPSGRGVARSDAGDDLDESAALRQALGDGPTTSNGQLMLGTYRDLWAGPVTEQSPALRFLKPEQQIELAPADAQRLGVSKGDRVSVSANGTSVEARVAIRERTPEGVVFLIEGTEEGNANALLNGVPRTVEIRKVKAE